VLLFLAERGIFVERIGVALASTRYRFRMHAIQFLRDPAREEAKRLYAVFGDEAWLRREVIYAIGRLALGPDADDLALVHFDGDKASLADVLDELHTLPFLSRCRVVVVDGADPFVTAHRQELETYVGKPASSGVLVLSVKTWTSTTKLAKQVQKEGLAVECKNPRENELIEWLGELAQVRFSARLHGSAARLLVELIGPEISLLVPELEKLATYVGTRAEIRREDVSRMVGAGRIETIWKTLDAATTGRMSEALDNLDRLLASGEEPVALLAAVRASLRRVYHAGQLRLAHRSIEDACAEADIKPFAVQSTLQQHKHLGRDRVDRLPAVLLQADLDLKGSTSLTPRAVLERLFIWLARPRQDVTS
jgi:DNA polymerase III subunit delta